MLLQGRGRENLNKGNNRAHGDKRTAVGDAREVSLLDTGDSKQGLGTHGLSITWESMRKVNLPSILALLTQTAF